MKNLLWPMETASRTMGGVSGLTGDRLTGNIAVTVRPMRNRQPSFMTPDRSTLRTGETHANTSLHKYALTDVRVMFFLRVK